MIQLLRKQKGRLEGMAGKSISEEKCEEIREIFARLRDGNAELPPVEFEKIKDIDAFYSQLYVCLGLGLNKDLFNNMTWWLTNTMYEQINIDDEEMAVWCRIYVTAVCISSDRFKSVLAALSVLGNYLSQSSRWCDKSAHKAVYDAISDQLIQESRRLFDKPGGFAAFMEQEKKKINPNVLKLSEGLIEYIEKYDWDITSKQKTEKTALAEEKERDDTFSGRKEQSVERPERTVERSEKTAESQEKFAEAQQIKCVAPQNNLVSPANENKELKNPNFMPIQGRDFGQPEDLYALYNGNFGYDTEGTAHKDIEKKKKIIIWGLIAGIVFTAALLIFCVILLVKGVKINPAAPVFYDGSQSILFFIRGEEETGSNKRIISMEESPGMESSDMEESSQNSQRAIDSDFTMLDNTEKNVKVNAEITLYEDSKLTESIVDEAYADITLSAGTIVEVIGYNENTCVINCTDSDGTEYTGVYVERGKLDITLP